VAGEVERDHAEVSGDRVVVHEMAELPRVGARGVETQQRDPLPGLLDVDAMRTAGDRELEVSSGDRLDRLKWEPRRSQCPGAAAALLDHAIRRQPSRSRHDVLDILQVLHQQVERAVDPRRAALHEREEVVPARLRHRLPEARPRVERRADCERELAQQERSALDVRDASLDDAHEPRCLADLDQERRRQKASPPHERGVGVHELGQAFDRAIGRKHGGTIPYGHRRA
jgi:hypothetical protein